MGRVYRAMGDEMNTSSEKVYRAIFDGLPISIWIEDWSSVKEMVDALARDGVVDWRRYFEDRPDQTIKAADTIDVIDVNQATLALYDAKSKEEVIASTLGAEMGSGELNAFREQLIAFAEGENHFTIDADELTMDDVEVRTRIRAEIVPTHGGNWSQVICAVEAIVERAQAEAAPTIEHAAPTAKPDSATITERVCREDLAYWKAIKDSTKAKDYEAYLKAFPEGIFVSLARRRTVRMGTMAEPSELSPTAIGLPEGLDFDRLSDWAKENTERAKHKARKPLR